MSTNGSALLLQKKLWTVFLISFVPTEREESCVVAIFLHCLDLNEGHQVMQCAWPVNMPMKGMIARFQS